MHIISHYSMDSYLLPPIHTCTHMAININAFMPHYCVSSNPCCFRSFMHKMCNSFYCFISELCNGIICNFLAFSPSFYMIAIYFQCCTKLILVQNVLLPMHFVSAKFYSFIDCTFVKAPNKSRFFAQNQRKQRLKKL